MTYAQNNLIEAVDYNTLVGSASSSTPNAFNTTWSTGSGSAGYGQPSLPQVGTGEIVDDATWRNLLQRSANVNLHQNTIGFNNITLPTEGDLIAFLSSLPTNLQLEYNQRLNASIQGATSSNTVTTTTGWTNFVQWTHTVTFANGDAARYFFNSGGQIKMTGSHPAGTNMNLLFNGLASNVGTVVISSISSGTVNIAGTTYNGITKIGGGGNAPTILPNNGYYALTTTNANVFTQTASTGPASYLNTFIRYSVRSNGPQGANGDTGSIITITTTWDEVPNNLPVSAGSSVTCTVQFPESTYIANTWGPVSVEGIISSIS